MKCTIPLKLQLLFANHRHNDVFSRRDKIIKKSFVMSLQHYDIISHHYQSSLPSCNKAKQSKAKQPNILYFLHNSPSPLIHPSYPSSVLTHPSPFPSPFSSNTHDPNYLKYAARHSVPHPHSSRPANPHSDDRSRKTLLEAPSD